MKFPYKKLPLSSRSVYFGSSVLKPIIPVKITYHDHSIKYHALIDSGADFCIFDAEIGIYLGINVKVGTKERFGGIQERNGAAAYLHIITLDIGGNLFKTSVGFSYDIAKHGFGILGEKGFFELFS